MVTDNDGATGQDSLTLRVKRNGGDCSSDCTFNTPSTKGLKVLKNSFKNVYVLGSGGPSMDNIREFAITSDARYNGFYRFEFNTNNGNPQ